MRRSGCSLATRCSMFNTINIDRCCRSSPRIRRFLLLHHSTHYLRRTIYQFVSGVFQQPASDAAGNSCAVSTSTAAPVSGTTSPALVNTPITVRTNTSFDPTTGSGTESASSYVGGHCNGAVFDMTGATKVATFTDSFDVSDSGNRIEVIVDTFNAVGGIIEGLVDSGTFIRQHPQN